MEMDSPALGPVQRLIFAFQKQAASDQSFVLWDRVTLVAQISFKYLPIRSNEKSNFPLKIRF